MAQTGFGMSGAAADLGLGSNLSSQVKAETEEERKKRLLGLSTASPAVQSLFGIGAGGAGGWAGGMGGGRGF
jgi:hypothetical protein